MKKTTIEKNAKAKWKWLKRIYLEIDELKERVLQLEKTVKLLRKKINKLKRDGLNEKI